MSTRSPSRNVLKEAMQRARIVREELRQQCGLHQEPYTLQELYEKVLPKLGDLEPHALPALAAYAVAKIDREAPSDVADDQPLLFQEELEGDYKLGDGHRMPQRYAFIEHADTAQEIDDRNAERVILANTRKRLRLAAFRPYWGPGVTKEEAIDAYRADHGDTLP